MASMKDKVMPAIRGLNAIKIRLFQTTDITDRATLLLYIPYSADSTFTLATNATLARILEDPTKEFYQYHPPAREFVRIDAHRLDTTTVEGVAGHLVIAEREVIEEERPELQKSCEALDEKAKEMDIIDLTILLDDN